MTKFGNIYAVEMKKIFRGKLLLIFGIIIIIAVVVLAGAFALITKSGINFDDTTQGQYQSPEEALSFYQTQLNEYDKQVADGTIKPRFWSNDRGQIESYVTYYKYLVDNGLSLTEVQPYFAQNSASQLFTSMGFVRTIMAVVASLSLFVVVILSVGNMMGEMKSGNMKMILLRPVSRNAVFTAKWCASMTGGLILFVGATLLAMVVSLFLFGGTVNAAIMIVGKTAVKVSSTGVFALEFLSGIVSMLVYCQFAYFLGALFNSKNLSLALTLVMLLFGDVILMVTKYIFIGFVDLNYNLNFLNMLSVGNSRFVGSSIYTSVTITVLYLVLFMTTNYLTFKHKEIN